MVEKNGLREYKPEDIFEDELIIQGNPHDLAEVILKLQPGEKITRPFFVPKNINDTSGMQRFMAGLKNEGIDIGRGDSKYGFKMPLLAPNYHPTIRELIIFRRK